jgi:hypothetical protein
MTGGLPPPPAGRRLPSPKRRRPPPDRRRFGVSVARRRPRHASDGRQQQVRNAIPKRAVAVFNTTIETVIRSSPRAGVVARRYGDAMHWCTTRRRTAWAYVIGRNAVMASAHAVVIRPGRECPHRGPVIRVRSGDWRSPPWTASRSAIGRPTGAVVVAWSRDVRARMPASSRPAERRSSPPGPSSTARPRTAMSSRS